MADLSAVERLVGGVVVVEEEHVDEGDEEAGGVPGGRRIVRDPLVEDEDDQVAEQAGHEDDLRDEAQVDVQRLVEVPAESHNRLKKKKKSDTSGQMGTWSGLKLSQVVEEAETNSKQHVDDSQDDGHLHLEGVQERQLVGGDVPYLHGQKVGGIRLKNQYYFKENRFYF